ncbi:unnamed protein product, partial [Rotaria magnacalcarata]
MSHPIQQYKSDNDSLVDQQLEKSLFDSDHDDDIFRSFFGLANRMMSETLRSG